MRQFISPEKFITDLKSAESNFCMIFFHEVHDKCVHPFNVRRRLSKKSKGKTKKLESNSTMGDSLKMRIHIPDS